MIQLHVGAVVTQVLFGQIENLRRVPAAQRGNERPSRVNRRAFLGTTLGIAAVAPVFARQQTQVPPYEPRDWSGDTPLMYPDPDIIALDDRFRRYILFNTPIRRHYVGTLWAEGPAWNGVGRFVV